MKNGLNVLVGVIIIAIVAVLGIKYANDHKECETKTEIDFDKEGNRIVSEIHICKEKFNF